MATLKAVTPSKRGESLRGKYMVDTVRGVLRIRKWPKKRGTPTSALQRWWIDWFRQANKLAKYVDAATARRAIELTAGTGMYPRDIILKAMRGRLYSWQDQNGKKWYPMAAVQDISESLDVLAQDVGSVLTRFADRWRTIVPGAAGEVLTSGGPDVAPTFEPAAGGGGFEGGALCTKSANQSVLNSVWTAAIFDQEAYDTAGIHDNVTLNTRLVVPVGTTWISLSAGASWASSGAGMRSLTFRKNGSYAYDGRSQERYLPSTNAERSFQTPVLAVVAGDYFELMVSQSSGGALNLLTHNATFAAMHLL